MDSVQGDLCRVTVIAPTARLDVALPASVPLADLVPTLLLHAGEDLPDQAAAGGAWSLQRFGGSRLDIARSATALALRDGEILYLRPRIAELPQLAFDDVPDAIAAGATSRPRWRDHDTRRAALAVSVAALAATFAVLVGAAVPVLNVLIVSAAIAVILLAAATALARAYSDAYAGAILAFASTTFAGLGAAAAFAPSAPRNSDRIGLLTSSASMLAAAAVILIVTVLAATAVSVWRPWFIGLGVAAGLATLGGLLDVASGLSAAKAGAVTGAVALALVPAVPAIALRLAKLPLPAIPTSGADVRRDVTMVAGADVVRRTVEADVLVNGLISALATVIAGSQLLIAGDGPGAAPWLMAALAAATALRARAFRGRVQRGALLAAATVGAVALALEVARNSDPGRYLVIAALLTATAATLTAGLWLAGHRPSPAWRWGSDVIEALIVLSIVPLALAVLGVYGYARGLTGG